MLIKEVVYLAFVYSIFEVVYIHTVVNGKVSVVSIMYSSVIWINKYHCNELYCASENYFALSQCNNQ